MTRKEINSFPRDDPSLLALSSSNSLIMLLTSCCDLRSVGWMTSV